MSLITMLAVAATIVTNPAPPTVSLVSMTPKERMELRNERSREMLAALHADEARREAFRYERRKRILNRAAYDMLCASEPSNAVTSVSVDYGNGDIRVEYADGHRLIQRFTPPVTNETRCAVRASMPRRKEGK